MLGKVGGKELCVREEDRNGDGVGVLLFPDPNSFIVDEEDGGFD